MGNTAFIIITIVSVATIAAFAVYSISTGRRKTEKRNNCCANCVHYRKTHIDRVPYSGMGRCNLAETDGSSQVFVKETDKCGNFKKMK